MDTRSLALSLLAQEARALLTRLARVKPFALQESMVPAASLSPMAQSGIERHLLTGRREMRTLIHTFLGWIESPDKQSIQPSDAQRRYAILRLKFNAVLTQFDVFAGVITQRSEHETGVWLSGLDVAAVDALTMTRYYSSPPVICYLDRGIGAAIRRARTRLPGGGLNPVAVIRIPRERMVGSGIASSLVHEVGHQAAALLDLVNSLRPELQKYQVKNGIWRYWERWISEIVSDFWSVARVGVASTLGLMGVVSLPRPFVFRVSLDDPHPIPWIRVKLSCEIGKVLYPHPQWQALAKVWEACYPTETLTVPTRQLLSSLEASIPEFVEVLVTHRPKALRGQRLMDVMEIEKRQPDQLVLQYREWRKKPYQMYLTQPSMAFAVIGQARLNGLLTPEAESDCVGKLLTHWALQSTLDVSAACAAVQATKVSLAT